MVHTCAFLFWFSGFPSLFKALISQAHLRSSIGHRLHTPHDPASVAAGVTDPQGSTSIPRKRLADAIRLQICTDLHVEEIIMGYPGWPQIIRWVAEGSESEKAMWGCDLGMEEGATTQGMWVSLKAGKSKATDSPLQILVRMFWSVIRCCFTCLNVFF